MFYVYILKSNKDEGLYIGYSKNLKQRIDFHKNGLSKSTKHRRPLILIFYEAFINKTDARKREIYLKSGYGRKQLNSILKNIL